MRSLLVARKLRDIASAQDAQISALRSELARLEARSFPALPAAPLGDVRRGAA